EQMFVPPRPSQQIAAAFQRASEGDLAAPGGDELEADLRAFGAIGPTAYAHGARLRAELAGRDPPAGTGAPSPAAYVAACDRTPVAKVKRQFATAGALAPLPAVLVALEAGAITRWHAELLLRVDTPRTHDALVAEQVTLVRWAM